MTCCYLQERTEFINFSFHFIMANNKDIDARDTEEKEGFYVIPDDETEDQAYSGSGNPKSPEGVNPFILFLKVLFNPVNGWKGLKRANPAPERMAQGCYYPVLAVLALSCFAMLFYVSSTPLQSLLVEALISFISYFLGYFTVIMLLKSFLPADCRRCFDAPFGRNFVMVAMTSLAMVRILIGLVPFFQPVLVFLPLYTIFMIVKGVRFLRCGSNRETLLMVSVSLLTIGVPWLMQWIFVMMIPRNL